MALPINFTLVRHGLSEANRIQKLMKSKDLEGLRGLVDLAAVVERHDSSARLTPKGVAQAEATGKWLRSNLKQPFDRFYVSPHIRTCETAYHLHLDGDWVRDDRFRERDWGEVAYPNEDFTSPMSLLSQRLKKLNEWYWKPQGGESLATGVRARVELVRQSLFRLKGVNNVVAVTHGEFIRVAQFVIERLTPDYFNEMDANPVFKVENTMVIEYTRQNPEDARDLRRDFAWRRAICPWDERKSWNGGAWVEFHPKTYNDHELLALTEKFPRFFTDEQDEPSKTNNAPLPPDAAELPPVEQT